MYSSGTFLNCKYDIVMSTHKKNTMASGMVWWHDCQIKNWHNIIIGIYMNQCMTYSSDKKESLWHNYQLTIIFCMMSSLVYWWYCCVMYLSDKGKILLWCHHWCFDLLGLRLLNFDIDVIDTFDSSTNAVDSFDVTLLPVPWPWWHNRYEGSFLLMNLNITAKKLSNIWPCSLAD